MLYLPETLCAIHSRAMDQEGVEEHRIAWTHLQVDPGGIGIIVLNTMVHFVHATLQNETTNSSVQSEHCPLALPTCNMGTESEASSVTHLSCKIL